MGEIIQLPTAKKSKQPEICFKGPFDHLLGQEPENQYGVHIVASGGTGKGEKEVEEILLNLPNECLEKMHIFSLNQKNGYFCDIILRSPSVYDAANVAEYVGAAVIILNAGYDGVNIATSSGDTVSLCPYWDWAE